MNRAEYIQEALEELLYEKELNLPPTVFKALCKDLDHAISCFEEIQSYGRPSLNDMVHMHFKDERAKHEDQIRDNEREITRLRTEITDLLSHIRYLERIIRNKE